QLTQSEQELARVQGVLTRIQEEAAELSAKVAGAEERNTRIPELETDLTNARRETEALQQKGNQHALELATLRTTLAEERKGAGEKLQVLADAQREFSNAFKALSAEALKNNNSSFLDLAKSTLEKFQEGARTDLSSRQKAIDEIVKP